MGSSTSVTIQSSKMKNKDSNEDTKSETIQIPPDVLNAINDETEEINRSSSENNLINTSTEEYITETTQSISLKTELKKIPKSIKQPPSISISQSNSVTEDATNEN